MRIVCLGDSLVSGYGAEKGESWVDILNRGGRHQWINAGIAGDTTGGMLARLSSDVFPHKPCTALIMGGYNDIMLLNSFDAAKANITAIAHQCVSAGIMPIICIPIPIYPTNAAAWAELIDIRLAEHLTKRYCGWLQVFADAFRFASVDLRPDYEAFIGRVGKKAAYLPDGVHPSPDGHKVIAGTLRQALLK